MYAVGDRVRMMENNFGSKIGDIVTVANVTHEGVRINATDGRQHLIWPTNIGHAIAPIDAYDRRIRACLEKRRAKLPWKPKIGDLVKIKSLEWALAHGKSSGDYIVFSSARIIKETRPLLGSTQRVGNIDRDGDVSMEGSGGGYIPHELLEPA